MGSDSGVTSVQVEGGPDSGRLVAGRYRLLARLGAGGMGTVWRAEDVVLGREVAVKEVLFPHHLSEDDHEVLRERTRREARAAARLDHPSAVTVYDVVEDDGAPFLVMELVDARTLAEVVRTDGPLTPQRTAEVGLAVLGALEAAHAQGIVHRDVKPGNVMLSPERHGVPGRVVLTDFGIAHSPGDSSITSTGLLLGSPSYIAPERARGQAPGPASDLWSLGATLFTAVEGRPPYDAGEPLATVTAVVTGEHEPFVAAGPLAPVLDRLLERDPALRLDATGARAALQRVAAGHDSGLHAAPPAAHPRPSPAAEQRAERTAALSVGEVRAHVAEEQPAARAAAAARPARTAARRPRPPLVVPAEARARRRRSRAGLAAALAVLLVVLGGVGYGLSTVVDGSLFDRPGGGAGLDTGDDDEQPPTDGLEPAATDVPADWQTWTEPGAGWSLRHPPSYEVSQRDGRQFRDPQARYTLRVSTTDAEREPVDAWQAASTALAQRLEDYRELRLEGGQFRGAPAADLEFTYFDTTDLQVLWRTFTVDGTAYRLYWQVNTADFDDSLEQFEQIAATFSPPPPGTQ